MDTLILTLLLLVSLVANAITVVWLIQGQRRLRHTTQQHQVALQIIKDDIAALCSGAVGIGRRLSRFEQRIRDTAERQDQLEMREVASQSLEQASRMVQKGTTVEELMAVCGMTRGEAELYLMMHRYDKAI